MDRNLLLNDNLDYHESKDLKRSSVNLVGEVQVKNELGEVLFTKNNIILLSGRRFILEKIFNLVPDESKIVTLSKIFGLPDKELAYTGGINPNKQKYICLFGVGRGGSDLTFGTTKKPHAKELNLYDMIPLRYLNEDLNEVDKMKYYFRVEENGRIAYYLKKFEVEPHIVMKVGDMDYTPNLDDSASTTSSSSLMIDRQDVDCYIEMNMRITANDVREYYKATEGLNMCRINELALYTGFQQEPNSAVWNEYYNIEAFSKITFNNEPLDDETKELFIRYRIFI